MEITLGNLLSIGGVIVAVVGAHYATRSMFMQKIADLKLELVKNYVTKNDISTNLVEIKASVDKVGSKVDVTFEKLSNRIERLEQERRRATDFARDASAT